MHLHSIQTYVHRGQSLLRKWLLEPVVRSALKGAGYLLSGFCLSAAGLAGKLTALSLGLVCGSTGWPSLLAALGAAGGYLVFWGTQVYQPMVWLALGAVFSEVSRFRQLNSRFPLLMPAAAASLVAVCGVVFGTAATELTGFILYLAAIGIAFAATWLCTQVLQRKNPILDWVACATGVFALAQIMPLPYVGLGYVAAGALAVVAPFPLAALAGLALDLAGITRVPMSAVMILSFPIRFLPRSAGWLRCAAPAVVYAAVLWLGGFADYIPLPGLFLGGLLGSILPLPGKTGYRRGETGVAQVRLEVAAGVLEQTRQLLLEAPCIPVDEEALVSRAAARACGTCPYRKSCKDLRRIAQLPGSVLEKPLLRPEELPIVCRKSGRFLTELHRAQEQLRAIQADRSRQREYRAALVQQYGFLSEFLQALSDRLPSRVTSELPLYSPRVSVYGNRPEADNGDKCLRFSGTGGKYYVVLCDGMGKGIGAVQESRQAGELLRRMLTAGFPAEHALRSLNSLCTLRDRAAAVTVDLAEIRLDTGRTVLHKWGAAPSYLISNGGADRIGAGGIPPGFSVTEQQEAAYRLTLRRNQLLVLVSDGVDAEDALSCCVDGHGEPPGELAARLLSQACRAGSDDATVVTVHLTEA